MTGRYKAYSEYKESGIDWIGVIPVSWSCLPIKRSFEVVNGSTPRSGEKLYWDGDITWVTPADLSKVNESISTSSKTITNEGLSSCGTSLVPKGSLILSTRAPIGTIAIASKELCTNQGCKSLIKTTSVENKYVYYVLSISGKQLNNLGRGTTFLELSTDELANYRVPNPSIQEQQKIANFLDHETAKIDTLITKQEKLIELLKEKRQAVISHAVTKGLNPDAPMKDSGVEWLGEVPEHWKACPLKTISKFRQGKLHEPYIHEDGKFICVNSRFVSTEGEKFKYCSKNLSPVENEDILMVMSDLPNGRALAKALFVQGDNNFALNQRVCAITATEIDARFLYYQLNRNEYFLSFDDGCNQTNLSNYVFKNFPALVPYKAEQCEIAEYLDRQTESFDRLVEIANRQIELMKERKTALISAAVTGKIDVRDWEGEA
ncbi:restriction endonuclease subunit S [Vibrio sp. 1159]|uniref:restriction endonuclease subunit S n=1 Tax=unclassified Vibrio TaxID=2614977 RepID=UPI0029651EC1|nr:MULTISPECIES: restriction endonuclease subunit S [unclassified Vibrio]MDW2308114.1 restriction endonuclease subunit S [Vibrio sp. 1075]MDW2323297.1 restriction endonuclease subunit S [Vibrio sp. 1159]